MDETLTVLRLNVPDSLARTPRFTNSIESMTFYRPYPLGEGGQLAKGTMALRWCAASMIEARRQFAASTGTCSYQFYAAALDAHTGVENVDEIRHNEPVTAV